MNFKPVILLLLLFSCSLILPDNNTSSNKTLSGILIGSKPLDSDFVLSEELTTLNEGESKSIQLHLGKKPDSVKTVTITSDNPALEINNSKTLTLSFTPENYSSDQTFTVTALIDENQEDETGNITISAEDYIKKVMKIKNVDIQGVDDWISIYPTEARLPLRTSLVNIIVKLKIPPSEDVTLTIVPVFEKSPIVGADYSMRGIMINSPLTFTRSNYDSGQSAVVVNYEVFFNPDFSNNLNTFRIIGYSSTFSANADIFITIDSATRVHTYTTFQDPSGNKLYLDSASGSYLIDSSKHLTTWKDAILNCNALKVGNLPWRLPTRNELVSLDTNIITSGNGFYWTATGYEKELGWGVNLPNKAISLTSYQGLNSILCISDTYFPLGGGYVRK